MAFFFPFISLCQWQSVNACKLNTWTWTRCKSVNAYRVNLPIVVGLGSGLSWTVFSCWCCIMLSFVTWVPAPALCVWSMSCEIKLTTTLGLVTLTLETNDHRNLRTRCQKNKFCLIYQNHVNRGINNNTWACYPYIREQWPPQPSYTMSKEQILLNLNR